jgi:hypothetical protein
VRKDLTNRHYKGCNARASPLRPRSSPTAPGYTIRHSCPETETDQGRGSSASPTNRSLSTHRQSLAPELIELQLLPQLEAQPASTHWQWSLVAATGPDECAPPRAPTLVLSDPLGIGPLVAIARCSTPGLRCCGTTPAFWLSLIPPIENLAAAPLVHWRRGDSPHAPVTMLYAIFSPSSTA